MPIPKILFVTGGVVSSLGKGVTASILGFLLRSRGIRIKIKKIDPYLNVDPGTLSPIEHGEVFVTRDGAETDLDLGHYERFGRIKTQKSDYITSGSIYEKILQKERKGDYLGKTVQVIPHVINEFKSAILEGTEDADILICEVGGTVGDIESIPILEAARQLRLENSGSVRFCHIGLIPYIKKAEEWKTKPVQHSVRTMLQYGIQPDLIVCRMESMPSESWQEKIAMFCNVANENVLPALDADSVYHAILNYADSKIDIRVLDLFKMSYGDSPNLAIDQIKHYVENYKNFQDTVSIAVIGKYNKCKDAYKSLQEALEHAAYSLRKNVAIKWIDCENFDFSEIIDVDGILVPGGFGQRGVDGKLRAIRFARENNIPYFGICFGMQLAVIDSLKDVLNGVSSSEFGACENPVIARIEEWDSAGIKVKMRKDLGGSMRLGSYVCSIKPDTLASRIYKTDQISERHRHRYEVNNEYLPYFEKSGLKVSGECSKLVEIVERADCDFFIGVQFHPEFESSIFEPNPLFMSFLNAAFNRKNS
jgi:CTP synthase